MLRNRVVSIAPNSIVLLGPTACGKTALAIRLALRFGGEILSADSRQVYRGLDIGSGKDLDEYTVNVNGIEQTVPYHLIDIADLSCEYSVFDYQQDFYRECTAVFERSLMPIVCGGTGMYLDAIIRGYDLVEVPVNQVLRANLAGASVEELTSYLRSLKPNLHNNTDISERHRLLRAIEIEIFTQSGESTVKKTQMLQRPDLQPLILGITWPRNFLRQRITERLRSRLKSGMIEEVRCLHENGAKWERLERLGLEYRFIAEFLQKKIKTEDELFRGLNIAIGQFAKRQETWFRGMERKGVTIEWIPHSLLDQPEEKRFDAITDYASRFFI